MPTCTPVPSVDLFGGLCTSMVSNLDLQGSLTEMSFHYSDLYHHTSSTSATITSSISRIFTVSSIMSTSYYASSLWSCFLFTVNLSFVFYILVSFSSQCMPSLRKRVYKHIRSHPHLFYRTDYRRYLGLLRHLQLGQYRVPSTPQAELLPYQWILSGLVFHSDRARHWVST